MKKYIILLSCIVFVGCNKRDEEGAILVEDYPTNSVDFPATNRFTVKSQGSFNAGYSDHKREILIITDNKTEHKYLGITGVGITELFQEGASTNRHTVEE